MFCRAYWFFALSFSTSHQTLPKPANGRISFGRNVGPKGPGIVLLIPVIDRAVRVDLREQLREVPHQVSITKDNAPISIDFLWYFKVLDPAESVLQVGNFEAAAAGIAATTLRAVIGGIPLDDGFQNVKTSTNLLLSPR